MECKSIVIVLKMSILHFILLSISCIIIPSLPAILISLTDPSTYYKMWSLLAYLLGFFIYGPVVYIPITSLLYYILTKYVRGYYWILLTILTVLLAISFNVIFFQFRLFGLYSNDHSYETERTFATTSIIWAVSYVVLFRLIFSKLFNRQGSIC